MKALRFSFKNEAVWMMLGSAAPALIAILIVLAVVFLRRWF